MEELLKAAIKSAMDQAPALVIMMLISITFAKALVSIVSGCLRQLSEGRAEVIAALSRMHEDGMQARQASRETIETNTMAAREQAKAVSTLAGEIKELRHVIQRAEQN